MKLAFAIPLLLSHVLFPCEPFINTNHIKSLVRQIVHRHSGRTPQSIAQLEQIIYRSTLAKNMQDPTDVAKRITFAIKKFHAVPGFVETLTQALQQNVEGHWYEIETALKLLQENKKIIAFNELKKMPSRAMRREMDIIVENEDKSQIWVECKCSLPQGLNEKIATQFLEQQRIVHKHAETIPTHYIISSKNPPPQAWSEWFDENDIEVSSSDSSDYEYDSYDDEE